MKKFTIAVILMLSSFNPLYAQFISGYVYLDEDGDGTLLGLEGGLSSVRVLLYEDNGDGVFNAGTDALVATQTTDIRGIYTFDLRTTTVVSVNSDNDDAEEADDGDMDRGSSDLEMMEENNTQRAVGMRFRNINIPQGETIDEAFITFTADETDNIATNLTLYGENTNNSGGFSNAADNITNRTSTIATVPWDDVPAWNAVGQEHNTPNLAPIIQEIVGRGGWDSGNALSIMVTGTGKRVADSYDGSSTQAPRLTIKYSNPSALGNYFITVNNADLLPGGTFTEPDATGVIATSITSTTDSLTFHNIGYVGEAVTCFLIPEDEDRLEIVNRASGYNEVAGPLNSPNGRVEAVSLDVNSNTLYAMDADELGIINLQTGAFITRGNQVGNGNGSAGNVNFDDVDALSYDFNDNVLYGVQANSGRKLIVIDPATGLLVQNAFGAGVDYLEITGPGLLNEISDLTFAPATGDLYGINTSGSASQVIQINKNTGIASVVSNVIFGGNNLVDIEALAFTVYNTNTIYVTTGTVGATENTLYSVDLVTGVATQTTAGGNALTGDDYESCDCFFKAVPSLVTYDPLPLELLRFSGKANGADHELHWETASEINFSHFEIYRSFTGKNFHKIEGKILGKGDSSPNISYYDFNLAALQEITYYKLKMVDTDGSYQWSRVISIQSEVSTATSLDFILYPNPAATSVSISLENAASLEKGQFSIYSVTGQLIDARELNLTVRDQSTIGIDNLASGLYMIRLQVGEEKVTKKLYVAN